MKQDKVFLLLSILFFLIGTFLLIRGLIVFYTYEQPYEFAQASLVGISAQIQSALFYNFGFISLVYSLSLKKK